jgi:putative resolvase
LRFGSELVVKIAAQFNTNIVFLEDKAQNFEQTLAKDVLEIITVFSAKLYGSRSHKKTRKKMTSHNTS